MRTAILMLIIQVSRVCREHLTGAALATAADLLERAMDAMEREDVDGAREELARLALVPLR